MSWLPKPIRISSGTPYGPIAFLLPTFANLLLIIIFFSPELANYYFWGVTIAGKDNNRNLIC
jgi:hypothetical protein